MNDFKSSQELGGGVSTAHAPLPLAERLAYSLKMLGADLRRNVMLWTTLLLRVAVGGEHHPGMSRLVKAGVKGGAVFAVSLATILGLDFDRVIVGHGDVSERDGKTKLRTALEAAGFLVD